MVHTDDLETEEDGHGADYALTRRYLGRATGLCQIGASLYELAPGKKDWPLHFHHANDEAFYFLEGEGTVRLGDREHTVRAGSFVGCPRGDASGAHQVINTGDAPLRFLCISGMQAPDVTEYVEDGKMGVFCGAAPGSPDEHRTVNEVHRREAAVGYWE